MASYFVELRSVASDLSETVEAVYRWDGRGEVTIEVSDDDDEFYQELLTLARGGIAATDGSKLVTTNDGLAFLEALQGAYAGSRMYATEVSTKKE